MDIGFNLCYLNLIGLRFFNGFWHASFALVVSYAIDSEALFWKREREGGNGAGAYREGEVSLVYGGGLLDYKLVEEKM